MTEPARVGSAEPTAFDVARAVADTVLFEGYVLYPYRASSRKNQVRWQFGVLAPAGVPTAGEPSSARTECLVEMGERSGLDVRVRFLHVRSRTGAGPDWDEAEVREVDASCALDELDGEVAIPFAIPGGEERDGDVRRRAEPLSGTLRVALERFDGPYSLAKLRVTVENTTVGDPEAPREELLRHSLVSAHTLLAVRDGAFVSLLEPPEWARVAAESCQNLHTWPVLVGEPGRRDVMLSSPIILYDYPEVAPESPGDLFDATEIDEILTLRTMALTDAEKQEARATDERAAAVIDRADNLPPEMLDRLHGTLRYLQEVTGDGASVGDGPEIGDVPWWDPGADDSVNPEHDAVAVPGGLATRGSKVRLRPGPRSVDAQDMFMAGRLATVEAVFLDVDGGSHLAVTVDDDPAAELNQWVGRYRYYAPDEVELEEP